MILFLRRRKLICISISVKIVIISLCSLTGRYATVVENYEITMISGITKTHTHTHTHYYCHTSPRDASHVKTREHKN